MTEQRAAVPRSPPAVIARVLDRAEDIGVALVLAIAAPVFLGEIAADDVGGVRVIPLEPSPATYALLVALLVLAAIAPWLVRAARPKPVRVELGRRFLGLGRRTIAAEDVRAVRVAAGARGVSVAIAHGVKARVTFLEVESVDDAAAILRALDVAKAPHGEIDLRPRARSLLPYARGVLTASAMLGTIAYAGGAFGYHHWWAEKPYGLFAIGSCILSCGFLIAQVLRGRSVVVWRGAWDEHLALHSAEGHARDLDATASSADSPLARAGASARAWIARLATRGPDGGAYRGDAMKRDELWDALRDEQAPADVRMAAARVLRVRYAENDDAIVSAVGDEDVRVRVGAAIEDDEDEAAERIEKLGPIFRAR